MKRILGRISALAAAALLLMGLSVTAFAADASVTYEGEAEKFVFLPGLETGSDLFDNFKNVMPGDSRTQNITVKNDSSDSDKVRIYLRAESADDEDMREFLSQLSMTVKNGDETIYTASPDQTAGLTENVLLGDLKKGESADLTVTLTVPITLESKYANFSGDVKWVFTVEEFNEEPAPVPEPDPESEPETEHQTALAGDSDSISLAAGEKHQSASPRTGDANDLAVWLGVMVASFTVLILAAKQKRSNK